MNDTFSYKTEYQYLTKIMLNVTDDCNLHCKYCFVEQHPHYMTLTTAKQIVDWEYNNLILKKKLKLIHPKEKALLYFFGGEPTLCYNSIIVPLVNYCKEKYPNIFEFGLTTNGTLLNQEKIDFFYNNDFQILLSIDGDKITQDYNRPHKDVNISSFDLLIKNIPYLLQKYPEVCFRSTIYAPTVSYLFQNYLFAESLGFKNYEMIEDNRHPWSKQEIQQLKEEFKKIYSYRLDQLIHGITPIKVSRMNEWLNLTYSLLDDTTTRFDISNHCQVERCGLGTTSGSIGWDGNIYGCQEQTSKNINSFFLIGNIFNGGIDIEKHNNLLKFYYQNQLMQKQKKEECTNCLLNKLCIVNVQICPSLTYDLFKDTNSITEINCEIRKIYFYYSLLIFNIIAELNNPWLNNYLLTCISQKGGQMSRGKN